MGLEATDAFGELAGSLWIAFIFPTVSLRSVVAFRGGIIPSPESPIAIASSAAAVTIGRKIALLALIADVSVDFNELP